MTRIKGDKPYGLQFESTVQADLDARKEIPLLADLTSASTWTALNGAPNHYVGMTTFCLENKTRYELLEDDPTDIENWRDISNVSVVEQTFNKIISDSVTNIKKISTDDSKYTSFAGYIVDEGVSHCVYRAGDDHLTNGGIYYVYSHDEGVTWSTPITLVAAGQTGAEGYIKDYRDIKITKIADKTFIITSFFGEHTPNNGSNRRSYITPITITVETSTSNYTFDVDTIDYKEHSYLNPEGYGCATSGAIKKIKDGIVMGLYSYNYSTNIPTPFIAISNDNGATWTIESESIIANSIATEGSEFSLTLNNGVWYSVIRQALRSPDRSILLKSYDLKTWEDVKVLVEWNCPETITIGNYIILCGRNYSGSNGVTRIAVFDTFGSQIIASQTIASSTTISDTGYPQFAEDENNIYLEFYNRGNGESDPSLYLMTIKKSHLAFLQNNIGYSNNWENNKKSDTTYDFKASDYVTDKSNATAGLQALFDAVAKSELQIPNVLIEAGDYYCDNNLTLKHDCNIQGLGAALLFEDCPESIRGSHLHISPTTSTLLLTLAQNVAQGDKTIVVSDVTGLSVGDIITIQNSTDGSFIKYSNGKSYRQGEMVEIEAIESATNTLTLKTSTIAAYTTDACNLRMQPKVTVNITGLEVVAKDLGIADSPIGIRITYGYNCTLDNLLMSGSCDSQLMLRNCFKCLVHNAKVDYKALANVATNYAIQINSCYHIKVTHSFLKTTRHALTVGSFDGDNTIINRFISFENNTIGTYEQVAADFHSNVEYVTMRDNTITGCISLRGTRIVVRDNFISNQDTPTRPPIDITNLNSSDISIIDNYIVTNKFNPSTLHTGLIFIDNYVPLEYDTEPFTIRGNRIINNDPATTSNTLVFLRMNEPDETGEYLNFLSNVIVADNTMVAVSANVTNSLNINNGIVNIDINNNTVNRKVVLQTAAEHLDIVSVHKNRFKKGDVYALETRATNATVLIDNNDVEETGSCAFYLRGTPNVKLTNNQLKNTCTDNLSGTINRTAFCYVSDVKHLIIDGNELLNGVDANIDQLFHLNNTTLIEVGINKSNINKSDIINNVTTIKGSNQKLLTEVISGDSASNYQGAMVWDDTNKRYVYRVGDEYLPASSGLAVYTTSILPTVASAGSSAYWNYITPTALFSDGERWVNAFGQTAARRVGYNGQEPTLRTEASGDANFYRDLGFEFYNRDFDKVLRWNGTTFNDANNQTPVARMYGADSFQVTIEGTFTTVDRGRIFYKESWSQFLIWEGARFVSAIDGKTPRRFFQGITDRRPAISGGDNNVALATTDIGMQYYDTTVDKPLILQTNSAGELEWLDQNGRTPYKDSGYTRPTNLISYSAGSGGDSRDLGAQFFDLTLGRPIWWVLDGKWVDATGATV